MADRWKQKRPDRAAQYTRTGPDSLRPGFFFATVTAPQRNDREGSALIEIEIIDDLASLNAYRDEWDRLFESGDFEISTSFAWSRALFDHALESGDRFRLVRLAKNGQVCGLLPLVVRPRRLSRINRDLIELSTLYGTHGDILLSDVSEPVIEAVFKSFQRLGIRWERFVAERYVESNPRLHAMRRFLERAGTPFHLRRQPPTHYVPLHSSADEFFKSRSKNLTRNITKARNRLQKSGDPKIVDFRHFGSVDEAFDALLEIEGGSWKHEAGTSISSSRVQSGFFRQLCTDSAQTGWLHLFFLLFDGRPIAYDLGLLHRNRYSYLKTSYLSEFERLSPASALRASMVEDIIECGATELDFTAEPYQWQTRWTDEKREHVALIAYSNSLSARFLERVSAYRDRWKGRAL